MGPNHGAIELSTCSNKSHHDASTVDPQLCDACRRKVRQAHAMKMM